MAKTQQEIHALMSDWKRDRSWDLEQTEGYEDHREDLVAYSRHVEADDAEKAARYREEMLQTVMRPGLAWLAKSMLGTTEKHALEAAARMFAEMLLPWSERMDKLGDQVHELRKTAGIAL